MEELPNDVDPIKNRPYTGRHRLSVVIIPMFDLNFQLQT